MRQLSRFALFLALTLAVTPLVHATTNVIPSTVFAGPEDNNNDGVYEAFFNIAISNEVSVEDNGGSGVDRRAIFEFDLSSIPANAIITSASIQWTTNVVNTGPGPTIALLGYSGDGVAQLSDATLGSVIDPNIPKVDSASQSFNVTGFVQSIFGTSQWAGFNVRDTSAGLDGRYAISAGNPRNLVVTFITPPVVTAISPAFGPGPGGTVVTITGSNFIPGSTSVNFGPNAAASVNCTSPTQCTAVSPAGTGTVSIRVLADGPSADSSADDFTYTAGPPTPCASFAAPVPYSVGTSPFSVAVADFNGDGIRDLVTANRDSDNVSVLLGTGGGAFGTATNYAMGDGPYSVTVGDFTGDGIRDIATANQFSSNISVLPGTGPGTFGSATNYAAGVTPNSIANGDFNSDGRLDLAVVNSGSDSVVIYLQNGAGSFGTPVGFAAGGSAPSYVIVSDFDADGRSDLAVTNFNSNNVAIFLGNGNGTFGSPSSFAVATNPVAVASADFNSDGRGDLAVANFNSNSVSILLNTGTGSFGTAANNAVGAQPRSIAINDFNGDGKADLAVANQNQPSVSILLGSGTGAFQPADFPSGPFPAFVAAADFNGDNRVDLALPNYNNAAVSIVLNTTSPGTFNLSSAAYSVAEGAGAATITVTRSGGSDCTVTVNYSTSNGTAVSPADYATTTGTLTFAAGVTSQSFIVPLVDDPTFEGSETFSVSINTPTGGATLGVTTSATVTITDNDPPPTLAINSVTQAEGNAGATTIVFTVTLSGSTSQTATVNYATADGTASSLSDYAATSGTLTFLAGETSKTIAVTVIGDVTNELNETFTVTLSTPANATITTATGTGTIQNDDPVPTLAISSVTQSEGNAGTSAFVFTVTLTGSTAQTVTVDYATGGGTAVAPGDYALTTGTVTFLPGETSKTITVNVNGDVTYESDETFIVTLSNPTNSTITTGNATGTIQNDDPPPTLAINSVTQTEGNSGTTNFVFTVTLTGPTAQTASVNFDTTNGTATAASDYTATSGTLTFSPGTTTQTVAVPVIGDTGFEANETFGVTLSFPINATIATGAGTGTITNDDAAVADLALTGGTAASATAGTPITYPFTIQNNGPQGATGVTLTVTLPAGQSFASASGAVCSGSMTLTCSVPAIPAGMPNAVGITANTTAGGTFTVPASVTAAEIDPNLANNNATATGSVTGATTLIVTSAADSGNGTLRQAILDVNSGVCVSCTIAFNIVPQSAIQPTSPLPLITASSVKIDGTTQAGTVIDGSACGCANALTISASGVLVQALTFANFSSSAFVVVSGTGNVFLGNTIPSPNGIDLGANGVTANDAGDADSGANNLQNKPVLSSAIVNGGTLTLTLSVDSASVPTTASMRVEVFEISGSTAARFFTTCIAGNSLVNGVLMISTLSVVPGDQITATATSFAGASCTTPNDGTSELAAAITATGCMAVTPVITASGPTTFCAGGSVTLSAPAGYTSYAWSTGATTQSIVVTTPGNYTVTGVDIAGCAATSSPTTVTVNPNPTVSIAGPTFTCQAGDSVTLNASGTGIASFLWSTGATTPSITVSPMTTTTYSVTVTSGAGCTAIASHTVSITPAAPPLSLDAPTTVIAGGTAAASVIGASGGTYTWFVLNGEIVSGQGTPAITFKAGTSGSVTLVATTAAGACTAQGSAIVPILACATTPPGLVAPTADATGLTSPVTFTWTAVAGATGYELWVAQGSAAPTMIAQTTATTVARALASGSFRWYVIARLPEGCATSLQSETRAFSVKPEINCPTTAPRLVSPAGGVRVFSPVVFRWEPVTDATGYHVTVTSSSGAIDDLGVTEQTTILARVAPGDFTWQVEALFNGCPAVASAPTTFTIEEENCDDHEAATLTAPAADSTAASSTITFAWLPVEGADGYRVWTSVDGSEAQVIGETADTKLVATVDAGLVDWFVETLFEGCASTSSVHLKFRVPSAINCSVNQAPALIAPAGGSTTSAANVTFTWSSVGALQYELYLSVGSGTPILLTRTTGTSFTTEVPAGEIDWYVRALFNGCPTLQSASQRFTYTPPVQCTDIAPRLIAPLDDTFGIPSPVTFRWSPVPGATQYRLTVRYESGLTPVSVFTANTQLDSIVVPNGVGAWAVEAIFGNNCPSTTSSPSNLVIIAASTQCIEVGATILGGPSQISPNVSYTMVWRSDRGATEYVLQEATSASFGDALNVAYTDNFAQFKHVNTTGAPVTYYYRVRGVNTRCTPAQFGPWSETVTVVVLPQAGSFTETVEASALISETGSIAYNIPLGAEFAGQTFTATPTKDWLTVTPSAGTVPAGGTVLEVRANTTVLPLGSSTGGVVIAIGDPSTGNMRQTTNGTTVTTPVNVSLVTPVVANPKSTPPPDALIIPAVAHADGVNSTFQSDVRITNTSAQIMRYQLTFIPTGETGITAGRQATIEIEPGRTVAMDDVLRTWFSSGTTSTLGTLEIRPLTKSASSTSSAAVKGLQNFVTFASSRTFNLTQNGTFGQHIPAIPFANFVGRNSPVLSLQQIAQSNSFRTNLGFVEGSGTPATLLVSVFGDRGQKMTDFDVNLTGGQHLQLGSVLAQKGIQVNDGRIEVRVTSPGGKVTAYASVLDNRTNDSLLVSPVALAESGSTKFVLPGVAELSGGIPWQTDARVFNASSESVRATVTFQSLNGATAPPVELEFAPNEVKQLDRVLATMFGVTNDGGALHISTSTAANLIATARTYRPDASGGTFGQFIQAVTPNEAVAQGSRPMQILQVEQSARMRSNVGLAEVSGSDAVVEVTAIIPDSKVNPSVLVPLAANQFRQLNSILAQMGFTDAYNARVTVKVVSGRGRVSAYASVVDNLTADPTFVPGQ